MTEKWVKYCPVAAHDTSLPSFGKSINKRIDFLYERRIEHRKNNDLNQFWMVRLTDVDFMEYQLRFG